MQWILEQTGYSSVYLLVLSLVGNIIAWVLRQKYPELAGRVDKATPFAMEAGVPKDAKDFMKTAAAVYLKTKEKTEAAATLTPTGEDVPPVSATLFVPDGSTSIQVTHDPTKSATIQPNGP